MRWISETLSLVVILVISVALTIFFLGSTPSGLLESEIKSLRVEIQEVKRENSSKWKTAIWDIENIVNSRTRNHADSLESVHLQMSRLRQDLERAEKEIKQLEIRTREIERNIQ